MRKMPESQNDNFPKISLPWLIISSTSGFMFIIFLITMYLNFYTAWFFAVWMWMITSALIYDGISGKRQTGKYAVLSFIVGAITLVAGIVALCIHYIK